MRSFFGWAARRRFVTVDPTGGVGRAKTPDRPPARLPGEALHRILARADFRAWTIILIGAHLGLRRAETAAMRVEHWDRARNDLKVIGKGDRVRVLPVEGEVLAAMRSRSYLKPSLSEGSDFTI